MSFPIILLSVRLRLSSQVSLVGSIEISLFFFFFKLFCTPCLLFGALKVIIEGTYLLSFYCLYLFFSFRLLKEALLPFHLKLVWYHIELL